MVQHRGFTLIELLVVICCIAILSALLLPVLERSRERSRSAACAKNLGAIIKACHLYADAHPSWGYFPLHTAAEDRNYSEHGGAHIQNGRLALAQLYNGYVKDHRIFSCPANPSDTTRLKPYARLVAPTVADYTNYGYDPGHTPVHATAGVISDMGDLDPQTGNSRNHRRWNPGQNVAIGAGSIEWIEDARKRQTRDAENRPTTDDIFADNWNQELLPEELETWIIK